jgi:cytochrome c oxidase subunit II
MNGGKTPDRRIAATAIGLVGLSVLAGALVYAGVIPFHKPGEKVISITARRFQYEPASLTLKKGQPVILEFNSIDVVHGFNLPDFKIRADVVPGQKRRVRIVPEKVGSFGFHCDNFCGMGHEEMAGILNVVE